MRRTFALVLAIVLIFAMMPALALAEEGDAPLPWPEAEGDVITLVEGKTYGTFPGTIIISEGVTIEGNGANVLSNISIQTDQLVTIRNINVQPNLISESEGKTYSGKHGIILRGVGDNTNGFTFNVIIEDCVFGNPEDVIPAYRSISLNEPVGGVAVPQINSSLVVRNCTFNEAAYNINLLEADNITIDNNTFNSKRSAVQYTVNSINKNNINITNNTFDGTGIGLMAAIASGTFDGPNGNIGNIEGNTFNGTRVVVGVSDKDVETLTIPASSGLSVSKIHFSAYSANELFKPAATGPWSPALGGRLVISGYSGISDAAELANAIVNANSGDTLTLTSNIDITDVVAMKIDKAITIDMNGFDITGDPVAPSDSGLPAHAFRVVGAGSSLKLTSSTSGGLDLGAGIIAIRAEAGAKVEVGANVSIKAGLPVFIKEEGSTLDLYGKLEVATGSAYSAIQGNGNPGNGGTIINIHDGAEVISINSGGLYMPQDGVVNVSGGTITGYNSGIALKSGTLNISGGTILATGPDQTPTLGNNNGINPSGAAIQMESNSGYTSGMKINITGGTIISENGYALYEYIGNGAATAVSEMEISGGYISGGNSALLISDSLEQARIISITGGHFSSDPSGYVADGYKATPGNWTIGEKFYGFSVVGDDVVNEIDSVSAEAYSGAVKDDNAELTVDIDGESIVVSGSVPATVDKIVVTYVRTDGATDTVKILKQEGAFEQPGSITVGETTYSFSISGLSIMPAGVVVIPAKPNVSGVDSVPEDLREAVEETAQGVTADGLADAIDQLITEGGVKDENGVVINANSQAVIDAGLTVGDGQEIVIVAQPYMEIEVLGVTTNDSGKITSLRLDIEPMYDVIAVVVDQGAPVTNIDTGYGGNAAVVASAQSMQLEGAPIVVSVPLPDFLMIDEDNFFVEHVHGEDTYFYKVTVTGTDPRIATFTVPNGFSVFTFLSDTRSATIDFGNDDEREYDITNVGDAFPVPWRRGFTFSGWTFEDIAGSYTAMTDELLTELNGQTVTATASWTPFGGGGPTPTPSPSPTMKPTTTTATDFYMIDVDPPVITSITATPYGTNAAILEVTAADATQPIFYQWQVAGSWIDIPGATTARFNYTNLLPNTSYTVRVKVTDSFGNSAISQEVTFRTGAQAVTGLPDSYTLHKGQSVSWTSAAGATWNYDDAYLSMAQDGDKVTFTAKKAGETIVVYTVGGTQHAVFIAIYGTATIPQTGYSINPLSYVLAGLSALGGMGAVMGRKKRSRNA